VFAIDAVVLPAVGGLTALFNGSATDGDAEISAAIVDIESSEIAILE